MDTGPAAPAAGSSEPASGKHAACTRSRSLPATPANSCDSPAAGARRACGRVRTNSTGRAVAGVEGRRACHGRRTHRWSTSPRLSGSAWDPAAGSPSGGRRRSHSPLPPPPRRRPLAAVRAAIAGDRANRSQQAAQSSRRPAPHAGPARVAPRRSGKQIRRPVVFAVLQAGGPADWPAAHGRLRWHVEHMLATFRPAIDAFVEGCVRQRTASVVPVRDAALARARHRRELLRHELRSTARDLVQAGLFDRRALRQSAARDRTRTVLLDDLDAHELRDPEPGHAPASADCILAVMVGGIRDSGARRSAPLARRHRSDASSRRPREPVVAGAGGGRARAAPKPGAPSPSRRTRVCGPGGLRPRRRAAGRGARIHVNSGRQQERRRGGGPSSRGRAGRGADRDALGSARFGGLAAGHSGRPCARHPVDVLSESAGDSVVRHQPRLRPSVRRVRSRRGAGRRAGDRGDVERAASGRRSCRRPAAAC